MLGPQGGSDERSRGQFVADVKGIRQRARQQLGDGAITNNHGGKVEDAIALLHHAVATEIVCVLRYKFHAVCAAGLASVSCVSKVCTPLSPK